PKALPRAEGPRSLTVRVKPCLKSRLAQPVGPESRERRERAEGHPGRQAGAFPDLSVNWEAFEIEHHVERIWRFHWGLLSGVRVRTSGHRRRGRTSGPGWV